jgi:hypothetical protein
MMGYSKLSSDISLVIIVIIMKDWVVADKI